jgi:indolepyruvate ferredoxin oxidoreductase
MISPLKKAIDNDRYDRLGSSFEVVHINRPSFDIFGKKIEFDFSPKPWMLRMMKHLRSLRLLLPDWHKKEKEISLLIRKELLNGDLRRSRLLELDNIKGYRDVRYKSAIKYLGKTHV